MQDSSKEELTLNLFNRINLIELFKTFNQVEFSPDNFIKVLNDYENYFPDPRVYIYKGDKLTDENLIENKCIAYKKTGKCIVSKKRTIKVMFQNGETHIILLRKLKRINK